MARNPQRFERAAEFWGRHTLGALLVDEKSLAALAGAIDAVEGKPTFGLEHIQAFTMRHLPRLRVDESTCQPRPEKCRLSRLSVGARFDRA